MASLSSERSWEEMLLGNNIQPEMEKLITALKQASPEQIKAIYDFCLRVAEEKGAV